MVRRRARANTSTSVGSTRRERSRHASDLPHQPVFFVASDGSVPAREFLSHAPRKVSATMKSVVVAVAAAPPKRFAGGGYWEAMHGEMTGWYEIRVDGPRRHEHYRLFCIIDNEADGYEQPLLVLIAGIRKRVGTVLSRADHAGIRALGTEHLSNHPRRVV